jgi:hypothetical protein
VTAPGPDPEPADPLGRQADQRQHGDRGQDADPGPIGADPPGEVPERGGVAGPDRPAGGHGHGEPPRRHPQEPGHQRGHGPPAGHEPARDQHRHRPPVQPLGGPDQRAAAPRLAEQPADAEPAGAPAHRADRGRGDQHHQVELAGRRQHTAADHRQLPRDQREDGVGHDQQDDEEIGPAGQAGQSRQHAGASVRKPGRVHRAGGAAQHRRPHLRGPGPPRPQPDRMRLDRSTGPGHRRRTAVRADELVGAGFGRVRHADQARPRRPSGQSGKPPK